MKNVIKAIFALASLISISASAYELEINWPFENNNDWAVGSAHAESKYCLNDVCPLNALDFYTTSSIKAWDKPQGSAPVHAVISGPVYKYDDCFAIQYSADRQFRVKYYHMGNIDQNITAEGTFIEKGQFIGTYSNNKKASLCRGGSTSSPHVHISFFKKNEVGAYTPLDLNQIKIGHFVSKVNTTQNYSASCADFSMVSVAGNVTICPFNKVETAINTSVALLGQ